MAAAKIRDRSTPVADFEMTLDEALIALLPANERRAGDDWVLQVIGDKLLITRTRQSVPNGPP
jgi:hypothetical protein